MSVRKFFPYIFGLFLLTAVSSCSIIEKSQMFFEKSQKLILKGSSGKVAEADDSTAVATRKKTAHVGPVLTPPKTQSAKSDSVSSSAGKAVRSKRQKNKDNVSASSISKKELDAAKKDAEKSGSSSTGEAIRIKNSSDTVPVLAVANPVGNDMSIAGEWTIYSVRNNVLEGEERPYMTFDLKTRRFYGSNGCNYINGDLVVEPSGKLSFTNIISTQRLCEDAPFEHLINLALSDVRVYKVRQDGSVTYLDMLATGEEIPLVVLKRLNMNFLNGAWRITAINGTAMEEEASITIDVDEHRIHGDTGCNVFNGDLFIDPDKRDSMQFCNLVSTRMTCPQNVRETELLLALEEAESARSVSSKVTEIFSNTGELLLTLEKLDLQPRDDSDNSPAQ